MSYCDNCSNNDSSCIVGFLLQAEFLFWISISVLGRSIYSKLTFELCKLTMAKSQSMYFSSLDMREAYLSILVDGPPPSALYAFCTLFTSL